MKKNWTMRVGGIMLALTLITSCFVGGTFAKYTTSDSGSDTARVAKFGVTVTATGDTFATEYKSGQTGYENVIVVKSGAQDKVVAPGTYGQMAGIKITGQPEVAVKITYEATKFDLGDNWKDKDGGYYCPLKITVRSKTGTKVLEGTTFDSADAFESAVKEAIAAYDQTCNLGDNLTSQDSLNLTIDWAWAFETGDENTKAANNVKDTYLGNQAAEGSAATISLEVTTTVTQVD